MSCKTTLGQLTLTLTLTHLHSVEMQVVGVNGLDLAVRCLDELGSTVQLDVSRHLEVVLLLADERVVTHREVETFVCIDTIVGWRPATDNTHT